MKYSIAIIAIVVSTIAFFFLEIHKRIEPLWRTLFPHTIREHEQIYCSICDGRIWFWQSGTRLYSLGMTRAHIDCAAKYLREELEAQHIALKAISKQLDEVKENLRHKDHTLSQWENLQALDPEYLTEKILKPAQERTKKM